MNAAPVLSSHLKPLATRVEQLRGRVGSACMCARLDKVEEAEAGLPGFRVVLPNGIDVVVGVDLDMPEALFEVVRIHEGAEAPRYHFEAFSAGGFAGAGHLSAGAVLEVLGRYARIDARQPYPSQG